MSEEKKKAAAVSTLEIEHCSTQCLLQQSHEYVERCEQLLDEIKCLSASLNESDLPPIELRAFRNNVQSELRFLKSIQKQSQKCNINEEKTHALRSSNLNYFESVWAAAKSSKNLRSILTHVHNPGPSPHNGDKHPTVQVEIVAEDGLQWIKLSTITANRLMLELAKAGWEGHREGSTQEEEEGCCEWNKSVISQVPLVQSAQHLMFAARRTWVAYQHPKVIFRLQNVHFNLAPYPVRQLVEGLTDIGVMVQCADDTNASISAQHTPSVSELVHNMKIQRNSYTDITDTVNLDCTILLALASDISNYDVDPGSRPFNQAILHQLQNESVKPMLTSILFPALCNRRLICTPIAKERFEAIVSEIGTASERARAKIMMDVPSFESRQMYQKLCSHAVPATLCLPVHVLSEQDESSITPTRNSILTEMLSPINSSVFLTGWAMNITTITSNMSVAKTIEETWTRELADLEARGYDINGLCGPKLYIVRVARSLAGKGHANNNTQRA